MSVPKPGSSGARTYPRTERAQPDLSTGDRDGEALAFDVEHGRLYEALERAAQLAELANHLGDAAVLRGLRRNVARHIHDRTCWPA
jgi:hypothetical protein